MVINIETGYSDISTNMLHKMVKAEVMELFRDMETKHYEMWKANIQIGDTAEKEIENINENLAVAEAENHKFKQTIQELNETNNKLVKRVKYFEEKKEIDKKREESPPKIFEKLIQMNEALEKQNENLENQTKLLEAHNKSLIEECKNKNEENENLEEEVQKWKEQVEENYKHHYDQFEPVLLENEKLKAENKRFRSKMMGFQNLLSYTSDEFQSILKQHPNPNVIDPLVNKFINEKCVEMDNIVDGVNEYAPLEFDNLYAGFKEWIEDRNELNPPDKKSVKEALKDWQKNSKFGLDIRKKKPGGMNGYEAKPRFNLKVI